MNSLIEFSVLEQQQQKSNPNGNGNRQVRLLINEVKGWVVGGMPLQDSLGDNLVGGAGWIQVWLKCVHERIPEYS